MWIPNQLNIGGNKRVKVGRGLAPLSRFSKRSNFTLTTLQGGGNGVKEQFRICEAITGEGSQSLRHSQLDPANLLNSA